MSSDELLLDQRVRLGCLFDRYESLLTDRQRRACELLLRQDLSFAELADVFEVTRQGAFDLVRRAREHMEQVESSLGVLQIHSRHEALLQFLDNNREALPHGFHDHILELLGETSAQCSIV